MEKLKSYFYDDYSSNEQENTINKIKTVLIGFICIYILGYGLGNLLLML